MKHKAIIYRILGLLLLVSTLAYAGPPSTINQQPSLPGALRSTDAMPAGRLNDNHAYKITIQQLDDRYAAAGSGGGGGGGGTSSETLNFAAGNNISISGDDTTKTLTFSALNSWLDARQYTTLAAADAAATAAGQTLVISSQWNTVPATLTSHVRFLYGGKLNNSSAVTFTYQPEVGLYQIFVGAGSVSGLSEAYPEWWGAIDNAVSTTALQAALNSGAKVIISSNKTFYAKNLSITRANQEILVNGVLSLPSSCVSGDTLFSATSIDGIKILGSGVLDGYKSNQSGSSYQQLINFTSCNKIFIGGGLNIQNNYSNTDDDIAAVYIYGGNFNVIDNVRLTNWSKEGIWLNNVSYSSATNITAIDNDGDSWSAVQVGGSTSVHNRIADITTKNTGASAVGCDSQYSTVENINVDTVRYQNGLNLGHSAGSKPASYTTVNNVVIQNILDPSNTLSAGINVGGSSTGVSLSNISITNSTQRGINVGDGSNNVSIINYKASGINTVALVAYQAGRLSVQNMTLSGTNNIAIMKDQGASSSYTTLYTDSIDITASTTKIVGPATAISSPYIFQSNSVYDNTASLDGAVNISFLGARGTVTITNANARSNSRIILEPSNIEGMNAQPFISTQNDGSFVITTVNNGVSGAYARWKIQ